ncbi:MAG: hypothetical protein ACP5VR_07005 [Acidimicrobiales bacterium]
MHPYLIEQLATGHRSDLLRQATLKHTVSLGRPKTGPKLKWWYLRRRAHVLMLTVGELPTVGSP